MCMFRAKAFWKAMESGRAGFDRSILATSIKTKELQLNILAVLRTKVIWKGGGD